MSKIGIVICNFNKKDYLENCIKSILKQTIQNFTIYVSDNASTDGSIDMVRQNFSNRVFLLEAAENRGGSGGFNAGLREALKHEHEYIMLVDNDIVMDENNVETLYNCLENHKKIGIVGSKILKMDFPDTIQDFGARIDFENLNVHPYFSNEKDRNDLPELQYCDYVAACSLMIRKTTIDKIGLMPEENFIYWDDMEWGWKCNLSGYKVAACNKAIVWHKGGVNVSSNTFQTYYSYRNKSLFFAKYMPLEKQKSFKERLLLEYFRAIYACYYTGKINRAKTLMNAFDDALHNIKGKADDYKIRIADRINDKFEILLHNKKSVYFLHKSKDEALLKIISKIKEIEKKENRKIEIYIVSNTDTGKKFSECLLGTTLPKEKTINTQIFESCDHIFSIKKTKYKHILVDEWCNVIENEADFAFCNNFYSNFLLFSICYEDLLDEWIKKNTIYNNGETK